MASMVVTWWIVFFPVARDPVGRNNQFCACSVSMLVFVQLVEYTFIQAHLLHTIQLQKLLLCDTWNLINENQQVVLLRTNAEN